MNDRVLGVAQIGCGAFATQTDMPNFRDNPRVECLWCFDPDLQRAQALAAQFGVPGATDDLQQIMSDPRVDFVKISTPHDARLQLISAAAVAGKHIFCEKPLAITQEECLEIISLVRKHGVKLCVDLNRRASPAMRAMKARWQQHLESPRYSPWRYVETERAPLPEEKSTNFLMRVQDESSSYRPIHLDPLHGGGLVIGETTHWLDLAMWFFDDQLPTEVLAWGSTRLSHGIFIKFSGGDSATIVFDTGGSFDYPKEMYEVASRGLLLRSQFFVENEYCGAGSAGDVVERELFDLRRDDFADVTDQTGLAAYRDKYFARVKDATNSKGLTGTLEVDKGHANMLDSFIDAIINDTPAPCDELDGYKSTLLAGLARQSMAQGHALPVLVESITPIFV
jgi:predicted dehydrogenase